MQVIGAYPDYYGSTRRTGAGGRDVLTAIQVQSAGVQRCGQHVHRGRADKLRHKGVGRRVIDLGWRPDLLYVPILHDDNAIGHGHRLDLIMRHEDDRIAHALMQFLDLESHLRTQLCVEIRQGLIKIRASLSDLGNFDDRRPKAMFFLTDICG